MGRDGIKIIEFDKDDDRPSPDNRVEGEDMRIIEFDYGEPEERKAVATARDIGKIKIVEFEDDRPTARSPSPEAPRAAVKPVKIKDFGAEQERDTGPGSGAGRKIKIMEFD